MTQLLPPVGIVDNRHHGRDILPDTNGSARVWRLKRLYVFFAMEIAT
ncbi:hypothetical protein [Streptomyces sp. PRh5]|nr:hypothetical protein [Streptomyces sp. PRh5]